MQIFRKKVAKIGNFLGNFWTILLHAGVPLGPLRGGYLFICLPFDHFHSPTLEKFPVSATSFALLIILASHCKGSEITNMHRKWIKQLQIALNALKNYRESLSLSTNLLRMSLLSSLIHATKIEFLSTKVGNHWNFQELSNFNGFIEHQ